MGEKKLLHGHKLLMHGNELLLHKNDMTNVWEQHNYCVYELLIHGKELKNLLLIPPNKLR